MIIRPELQALRSDDAPQRRTQAQFRELFTAWRARPEVAEIERQFEHYRAGQPLATLPDLAALFEPGVAAGRFVGWLVDATVTFFAEQPLVQFPLRCSATSAGAMFMLFGDNDAMLAVQSVEVARLDPLKAPSDVTFTPGESHEMVLNGSGTADLVSALRCWPDRVELDCTRIELEPGKSVRIDGAHQCLQLRQASATLVSLKLRRRPAAGAVTRRYARADGRFVKQASASQRDSRLELAATLLGRMGRRDAAPLLAAMAEEEGADSLRWQALRECLGLDSGIGFAALCRIAARQDDPLALPAGALRAQLLEAYPELKGIAQCPA